MLQVVRLAPDGHGNSQKETFQEGSPFVGLCPKGPSAQQVATWALGTGNYGTGFGQVHDYQVLGALRVVLHLNEPGDRAYAC